MARLPNKVAVVSGGASGIGEGIAKRFAEEGAAVVIADINEAGWQRVADEINGSGGRCEGHTVDVGVEEQIVALFEHVKAAYGRLDIVSTNTFWSPAKNVVDTSLAEWNRTLDITLTAPFLFSKYAIPLMADSGGGSIVHTASAIGMLAARGKASYMAAKAGVIHLSKSIAVDFAPQRIRCNAVCPGAILTPATAADYENEAKLEFTRRKTLLGEHGTPEDIAHACVYLASDEAKFVTGAVFAIDSGYTII
ncbi:MAG: short-chain dehydrogenase [Paenibacillaceae bacterium]|jgi:NAD(P)-dependent dehydrogenase (short-subunit alcohol dehydrogenase family)|nr:short-chain dehydrogenase [Paenibacillaceae bacterium]